MRYLFRGVIRETGKIVEGHVEADASDLAYNTLADNGIVTEALTPDPKPLNLNHELPEAPEFADALESAFDSSSSQVAFDSLTERYAGKKVWVIDRDKIRRRVAQVVDAALQLSQQRSESISKTRERVANAISGMFTDNRNIASEHNAESIAGMKVVGGLPAPQAPAPQQYARTASGPGSAGLEEQIGRMAELVRQAEGALAAIHAAARRASFGGGGGGPRRRLVPAQVDEPKNEVLLEIFKTNLELARTMIGAAPPAPQGAANGQNQQPSS